MPCGAPRAPWPSRLPSAAPPALRAFWRKPACSSPGRRKSVDADWTALDGHPHRIRIAWRNPFDPPGGAGVCSSSDRVAFALPIFAALATTDDDIECGGGPPFALDEAFEGTDVVRWQAAHIHAATGRLRSVQARAVPSRRAAHWPAVGVTASHPDRN